MFLKFAVSLLNKTIYSFTATYVQPLHKMKEQNSRFAKLQQQQMKRIFAIENIVNVQCNVYNILVLKNADIDFFPPSPKKFYTWYLWHCKTINIFVLI